MNITIHDIEEVRDRLVEDLNAARENSSPSRSEENAAVRRLETIDTLKTLYVKGHPQGWGPARPSFVYNLASYVAPACAAAIVVAAWGFWAAHLVSKIPDKPSRSAPAPVRYVDPVPATLSANESPYSF